MCARALTALAVRTAFVARTHELDDLVQPAGLGAHLEQALLDLGPEVDAACDLVREAGADLGLGRAVPALGDVDEVAVGVERLLDGLGARALAVVLDR